MREIILIRPSGIWNSRAPIHNYILERRKLSRTTCLVTMSIYDLRRNAIGEDPDRAGDKFLLKTVRMAPVARQAWTDYRRSFPRQADGSAAKPKVSDMLEDIAPALYELREHVIIRLASLFESFAQCWAINYLAAKLESLQPLSSKERDLADAFSPARGKGHLPGWPQIVAGLPFVTTELSRHPHLFTAKSGEFVTAMISARLNAFSIIQFWRSYRNLAVHSSRLVTRSFYDKNCELFSEMMADLAHLDVLEPGKPMPLHDDMYSAMAAVQYRAVQWMSEALCSISGNRRGHLDAPGAPRTGTFNIVPAVAPRMFLPDDHPLSFRWTADADFRTQLSAENGWRNPSLKRTVAGKPAPAA